MDRIRDLVREAHRRSVWQVLSVYLVGSWGALQVVESVTENAGLPDWVPAFALILLIIGLPIVLATAVVQEGVGGDGAGTVDGGEAPDGTIPEVPASQRADRGRAGLSPSSEPPSGSGRTRRGKLVFTWRNAIAGGVAAFALLGLLVAGYFVMWSTGVGPVGSLAAQGVFEEGDAVVLAQFGNTSDDEALGAMVTEALRVDLAGSSIMTLVEPDRVRDALRRMGRTGDEPLDPELAREVAIRDGFKAVVHGTVGSAGSGYIFVASLTAAESGTVLASFRETAQGPDQVIDAIDKLSQDIRAKAGESLKVIKSEEPLVKVSTTSLEALRRYTEADRLADEADYPRAIEVLMEAIDLDPSFAMAYRRLAVLIQNSGGSLSDQVDAATKAYELRDRLTERERFLAAAYYHNLVTLDVDAEIRAYQTLLERYPDDRAALNNVALALVGKGRLEEAVQALERAVNGPGASASAFTNLPGYLAQAGRHDEADEAFGRMISRYPGREIWMAWNRFLLSAFRGDAEATKAAGVAFLSLPEAQGGWRSAGRMVSASGAAMGGNMVEAGEQVAAGIVEMRALGDWSQVLFLQLKALELDIMTGREIQAVDAYSFADLSSTLDSISPAVRDYEGVLFTVSRLGREDEVSQLLARWQGDDIPSSSGPVFEEARRASEANLAGREDPEIGLDAFNALSRDINCADCYLWTRARLAEEAGRLEDARTLYLESLSGGTSDFLEEILQRILAHEKLGGVYEALGESGMAAEHFARFAESWANADPEFQPRVQVAAARAEALNAGPPSEGGAGG